MLSIFPKGILALSAEDDDRQKPNILFFITDDQPWPHTSASGANEISTPAFDRVAREGVLFTKAFAAAPPQCSTNRAAILTDRNIGPWEEKTTC